MRWHRVDPVQTVSALLASDDAAVATVVAAMAGKSALFRSLDVAHGEGWAAIFAAGAGEDMVLPRLSDVIPLYEAAAQIWFPIGVALAVPDHAQDMLLQAMLETHRVTPPVILVPRFGVATAIAEADLYVVRERKPFHESGLGQAEWASAAT